MVHFLSLASRHIFVLVKVGFIFISFSFNYLDFLPCVDVDSSIEIAQLIVGCDGAPTRVLSAYIVSLTLGKAQDFQLLLLSVHII